MNLISPRYFENIASGCYILTEKNNYLSKLLPKISYNEFANDLSNFDQVLNETLMEFNKSKNNRRKNIRVQTVLKVIKFFLSK